MAIQTLGPKLKLARANRHIGELESLFDTFFSDNPHRVEIINNDPDRPGLTVRGVFDRPLPNDVATVIGDAIHNLRTALDHLAAAAVRSAGQVPTRYTGFPIYEKEADFDGGHTGKLAGAPPEFITFVKGLKPYLHPKSGSGGGNIDLWVLTQLDNLDKHDILLPTVSVGTLPELIVRNPDGVIKTRIGSTSVSGKGHVNAISIGGAGLKYEVNGEPTFVVLFERTGLVDDVEVVALLRRLASVVSKIIADAGALKIV